MNLEKRIGKFVKSLSNVSTSYQELIEELNGYNGWRLTKLKIDLETSEGRATMNQELKTLEQFDWLIEYYENLGLTKNNGFRKEGVIIQYEKPKIISLKKNLEFSFMNEKEKRELKKKIKIPINQASSFNAFIDLSVEKPLTYLPLISGS